MERSLWTDQTLACQSAASLWWKSLPNPRYPWPTDHPRSPSNCWCVGVSFMSRFAVRDVLIIKLVPSSTSSGDQENFSRNAFKRCAVLVAPSSSRNALIHHAFGTCTYYLRIWPIVPAMLSQRFLCKMLSMRINCSSLWSAQREEHREVANVRVLLPHELLWNSNQLQHRVRPLLEILGYWKTKLPRPSRVLQQTTTSSYWMYVGPQASKDPRQTPAGP